jgi:hypothetical protein
VGPFHEQNVASVQHDGANADNGSIGRGCQIPITLTTTRFFR